MDKIKFNTETECLYTATNFLRGFASVFNLYGNYYKFNTSSTPEEADQKAIKSDWEKVGSDIKEAKSKFEKENENVLCLK